MGKWQQSYQMQEVDAANYVPPLSIKLRIATWLHKYFKSIDIYRMPFDLSETSIIENPS